MTYNQEKNPDYIIDTARKADIPSLQIYSDIEGANDYYRAFQNEYRSPDVLVRNRGGLDITYGPEVFSGLSLDGRHMFSVRMPQMPFGTVLVDSQRYFVVSGDFHTKHNTEWWIDKVIDKTLFLSHQPISEVLLTDPTDEGNFSIQAVLRRRLVEREIAEAEYKSYTLTIGNSASISWGNGMRPEKFISFFELSHQLELLRIAEERTKAIGGFVRELSQDESEVA